MAFGKFLYFKHGLIPGVLIILLLLTLSCSKKSTDPDTNNPPDNDPIGVLLSGNASDPALNGTSDHGPFAVPDNEIEGDFVTTRLTATINPTATVGQVNTALNSVEAKISCMRASMMALELIIGSKANVIEAQSTCSALVASGSFLSAYPAFVPIRLDENEELPDNPANGVLSPLENEHFPAAWNARKLVIDLNSPVTVLVFDGFRTTAPHSEIPSQSFLTGAGMTDGGINSSGLASGNHGFQVAGVIGAKFDAVGATGVFPGPDNLLRLPCLLVDGFGSWVAVAAELASHLPATGQFIVNTSFGYSDNDFSITSKRQRIDEAVFWRGLIAGRQDRFLHLQSAGNWGIVSNDSSNATYNSPFTMSARFDSPLAMLGGTAVSAADTAALNLMWTTMIQSNAANAFRTHNLLVVGASIFGGDESAFSSRPADIRMIGETITAPCSVADAICSPSSGSAMMAFVNGTSFSTPQVAGLAAYMWSLSPGLTVAQTIGILTNCYNSSWVDAYKAVLSLDNSESNARVRKAVLDVANSNDQKIPDGEFTEHDIKMFLDSIPVYEANSAAGGSPFSKDQSRFDLNGDGFTGDTGNAPAVAPFDLDINVPPAYSSVVVIPCLSPSDNDTTFDEHALNDRDILAYYAYSSLFTGIDSLRDDLLGVSCSPFFAGTDSSVYLTYKACFPLGINENDTSNGGFASVNIDETRDSLSLFCKDTISSGFRFQLSMNGDATLSATAGFSNVSVDGSVSMQSTATASAPPQPSPCRFGIAGYLLLNKSVRFGVGGETFSMPMTLVVNGTVTPTNANGSNVALARCIVQLFVIDTTVSALAGATEPQATSFLTFDSDVNPLPFQINSFLTLLPEHSVYEMHIIAQTYSFVTTQVAPGTGEAKVDVSVSLFAGE